MNKLPFIILAGSPASKDELMEYADTDYKALIDIHGNSMIYWILKAIHESNLASYILIAGLKKEFVQLPKGLDESIIDYYEISGSHVDKIVMSANYTLEHSKNNPSIFPGETAHAVMLNADIPAITKDTISNYVKACGDLSASYYYVVVTQGAMDEAYPNNGRSYMKIENEYYAGGDMNMVDLKVVEPSYPLLKKITENKKSFIKALFFAAPFIFIKYILKRVKLKDVENLMTKVFGFESRLIISTDADIAFDVDKPFQLDLMRKHFVLPEY
ncbi:MAG: hypothetical protein ACXAD7_11995 [Candidatus Kariarchaeaceae archaeon]|jgi:hypothetical protein